MVAREVLPEGSSVIYLSYFNPLCLRPADFALEIANQIVLFTVNKHNLSWKVITFGFFCVNFFFMF